MCRSSSIEAPHYMILYASFHCVDIEDTKRSCIRKVFLHSPWHMLTKKPWSFWRPSGEYESITVQRVRVGELHNLLGKVGVWLDDLWWGLSSIGAPCRYTWYKHPREVFPKICRRQGRLQIKLCRSRSTPGKQLQLMFLPFDASWSFHLSLLQSAGGSSRGNPRRPLCVCSLAMKPSQGWFQLVRVRMAFL